MLGGIAGPAVRAGQPCATPGGVRRRPGGGPPGGGGAGGGGDDLGELLGPVACRKKCPASSSTTSAAVSVRKCHSR